MTCIEKMIATYVNYGLEESTWKMFHEMACHNLITNETWTKFYEICKGYTFDNVDGTTIIDISNNDKVVYKLDSNGYWKKV